MRIPFAVSLSGLILLLVSGCGAKQGGGVSSKDLQAFATAPPDLKGMWEQSINADKTNDYASAEMLLYKLLQSPGISSDQKEAVIGRLNDVKKRLDDGLDKGDPAAKAALDELRRNPPNRQQ